jgi:H+/Cl- antiporter ClcA
MSITASILIGILLLAMGFEVALYANWNRQHANTSSDPWLADPTLATSRARLYYILGLAALCLTAFCAWILARFPKELGWMLPRAAIALAMAHGGLRAARNQGVRSTMAADTNREKSQ